ncbi:hypothetical protein [Vulcanisaeta sp. JCM 16159]|uniref:hypothetical protein n=1 Tax=Vulcanisaeta sp. JCM 16159 TaxID=1295371 RepID=UPI000A9E0223|nr:hypothetical protein [Vulcanisaeta sp. JCM 16159]
MSLNLDAITKAVMEAKAKAKRRRFKQTYELIIRFKDFDVKNQANRFNITITLPHPLQGKEPRVCVMATGAWYSRPRRPRQTQYSPGRTLRNYPVIRRRLGNWPIPMTTS